MTLESAAVPGGRIITTNNGYDTRYFLTDHLGSVRAVVNNNGIVQEQSNYYAYGSRWNDGQMPDNRYLFNGKENQSFVEVPYLDYGARMYDPRLGRCHNIDPMAFLYGSFTPYNYCLNNPLKYIDWQGRAAVPVILIGGMAFTAVELGLLSFSIISTGYILQRSQSNGSIEFTNSVSSLFKDNPGWGEQQRRDRRNREEMDLSQANVQNSINNNFPDPNDYDPNKGPEFRSGGELAKILFVTMTLLSQGQADVNILTLILYWYDKLFGEDEKNNNTSKASKAENADNKKKESSKDESKDTKFNQPKEEFNNNFYTNYQEYLKLYFNTENSNY